MVVVIEEEKEEMEAVVNNPPPEQPKPRSPSPLPSATTTTTQAAAASSNGNESDGYKTASDRDVSDNEENEEGGFTPPHQKEEDCNDDVFKHQKALEKAMEKANQLKLEGNKLYVTGLYDEALLQYEAALQDAPDVPSAVELCSNCHANRAGKYEDTIKECTKALELNPTYIKAFLRRGEAHEKLEHFEEAIADMKKILELDPSNDQARRSIGRLEPLAAEKREKMKEEMMAKLKDMGNSLLGRFGMSIDNFKAVKDPNTGSYSISFQK